MAKIDNSIRRKRTEPISQRLNILLQPLLKKRGFITTQIITQWRLIIGERLADLTCPLRVSYIKMQDSNDEIGVLEILVHTPLVTELQHREPMLLQRINSFCGFNAIGKLKLKHGEISKIISPKRLEIELPNDINQEIESMVIGINNSQLSDNLIALGKSIYREKYAKTKIINNIKIPPLPSKTRE